MPILENRKHERFARLVAEGQSAAGAYLATYKCAPESAETVGPKLLRENVQVNLRVEELRKAQQKVAEEKLGLDREAIMGFLAEVVKTPIGDVNEGHYLCQEYSATPNQFGTATRYKMPSKLDAIEKIIKMAGYYAPEKVEHSGGITGLLQEITGAKTPQ